MMSSLPPSKNKNARLALWLQNIVTQPQARLGPVEESLRTGSKIKIVLSLRFESGPSGHFLFLPTAAATSLARPLLILSTLPRRLLTLGPAVSRRFATFALIRIAANRALLPPDFHLKVLEACPDC